MLLIKELWEIGSQQELKVKSFWLSFSFVHNANVRILKILKANNGFQIH